MTEMVKQLIKTLGASRRHSAPLGKRELALAAGGVLVGAAVGALSTVLIAARRERATENKTDG